MKGVLKLCGLGPLPARTASISALHALAGCEVVVSRREDRLAGLLSDFCPGRPHFETDGTARAVSATCRELSRGRDVGLATRHHPLFLGPLAPGALARLVAAASSVEILGSCSPVGLALATLQAPLDVESDGLRVYDWKAAASGRVEGSQGALVVSFADGPPDSGGRARLARALARVYPPQATCWLLGPGRAEKPKRLALRSLAGALSAARRESLLYVS